MADRLRRLSEKTGHKKFHLCAHSFTGVDARAAISMFGADEHVSTLTTICSPHKGMKVIHKELND